MKVHLSSLTHSVLLVKLLNRVVAQPMPTAAGKAYQPPRPVTRARARSAEPLPLSKSNLRQLELSTAREAAARSMSPNPTLPPPPPLYVVSEETAKRKYLALLRGRELRSAQRSVTEAAGQSFAQSWETQVARQDGSSSPPARAAVTRQPAAGQPDVEPWRPHDGDDAGPLRAAAPSSPHLAASGSPRFRFAKGSSSNAARSMEQSAAKSNGDASSSAVPQRRVEELAHFELIELVLQLQSALTLARKENLQLRLQLAPGSASTPLDDPFRREASRRYVEARVSRGTQTTAPLEQTPAAGDGGGAPVRPNNAPSADRVAPPPPRRAMDHIDQALEERRSRKLEKILLERTLRLSDMEIQYARAEEEAMVCAPARTNATTRAASWQPRTSCCARGSTSC